MASELAPAPTLAAEAIPTLASASLVARASTSQDHPEPRRGYQQQNKRKSSGFKMSEELLKKSSLRLRTKPTEPSSRYIIHTRKQRLLSDGRRLRGRAPTLETKSTGNLYLDWGYLMEELSRESLLEFLFKPKYEHCELEELEEHELCYDFTAARQWQGFPNLGNTCYMNAILQALFSIPCFGDDLLSQSVLWGRIPFNGLTLCMAQLLVLRYMYNCEIKEKILSNTKKAISSLAGIFSKNTQNDAHEFLGHILDHMKEQMKTLRAVWESRWEFAEGSSSRKPFAMREVPICPIVSNFEFELQRLIICNACQQIVLRTEINNYLSITLYPGTKGNPKSLQFSLDLFFAPEELEYKCETCQHKVSTGIHKFNTLPRVLITHLKRYHFTGSSSSKKMDQCLAIPRILDLSSHCVESTIPPPPLVKYPSQPPSQAAKDSEQVGLRNPTSSTAQTTSAPKYALALSREAEAQGVSENQPYICEEDDSDSDIMELQDTESAKLEAVRGEEPQACSSRMLQEEHFYIVTDDDDDEGSETISIPDEDDLVEAPLEQVPRPTLAPIQSNLGRTWQDSPEAAGESQDVEGMKTFGQSPQQPVFPSLPKPVPQEYTKTLQAPAGEPSPKQGTLKSSGKSGPRKKPRKITVAGRVGQKVQRQTRACKALPEKASKMRVDVGKAQELEDTTPKQETKVPTQRRKGQTPEKAMLQEVSLQDCGPHAYHLIGMVSHIGSSMNSGHFICDVFNFERQTWFSFNDLHVSTAQDIPVKGNGRYSTGYIFFYMQNDIYQQLLQRGYEVPE
ncbi:PREDICTED: ubiquitin carboxyl-terminal hydrolase 26 [Elephantulus edwardii]|uniref:ubiquitin carboxyl-terminal hydrolase 26 n=1 Tax=Elephantulus edwardii TaxID=28737 RepID=UPI0003F06563|nr:PREDICTED: ubiquitin carboxyl-terminal hydrolase 26 [Elephantulus edwardii]